MQVDMQVDMQVHEIGWSNREQDVAREAFERAHGREIAALLETVRERAGTVAKVDDVWRLHDFLSARRHDVDGKYEYKYSALIFVFARLIKEGWLHLEELEGLDKDKLTKISALTRM